MAEFSWDPSQTEIISSLGNELLREIKFKVEKKESKLNSYWERSRGESCVRLREFEEGMGANQEERRFQGGASSLSLSTSNEQLNRTLMNINSMYGSDLGAFSGDVSLSDIKASLSKVSQEEEGSDTPRSNIQSSVENYFVSLEERLTALEQKYDDVSSNIQKYKQESASIAHVKDIENKLAKVTDNIKVNIQESALAPIQSMLETLGEEFSSQREFHGLQDEVNTLKVDVCSVKNSANDLLVRMCPLEATCKDMNDKISQALSTTQLSPCEDSIATSSFTERLSRIEERITCIENEKKKCSSISPMKNMAANPDELAQYFVPKKCFLDMYTRLKCMEHLLLQIMKSYLGENTPETLPEIIRKINGEDRLKKLITESLLGRCAKVEDLKTIESRLNRMEGDLSYKSSELSQAIDSRILPISVANDIDLLNKKLCMLKEEQVPRSEFYKLEKCVSHLLKKWDSLKTKVEMTDRKTAGQDFKKEVNPSDEKVTRILKKTISSFVVDEMKKLTNSDDGLDVKHNKSKTMHVSIPTEEILRIPTKTSGILSVMVSGDRTHLSDKTALIIIHDLGMNSGAMKGIIWNQFANHHSKLLFIFLDLPGQQDYDYDLEPDQEFTDLEILSRDLVSVLDILAVGSVVCLGTGIGSYVATQFSMNHPTRTSALILIDAVSNPAILLDTFNRKFSESINENEKHLIPECKFYSLYMISGQKFINAVQKKDNVREICDKFIDECKFAINPRNLRLFHESFKRASDISRFTKTFIKCKALLLVGTQSIYFDATKQAFETMERSRTKFIQLDGIERTLTENPAKVVGLIEKFLEDIELL